MSKEEQTPINRAVDESTTQIQRPEEDMGSSIQEKDNPESLFADEKKQISPDGIGSIPLQDYSPQENTLQTESGRLSKQRKQRHAPRGRRKKSVKRPWYVVGLLIIASLIAVYAVATFFLVPTLVKGPVVRKISELTGYSVRVKNVLFSPFTMNLRVSEIVLSRSGKGNRDDTLLTSSSIQCNLSLITLLTKKSFVERLIIDKMVLNLIRYQGMDFNISRLHREMINEHPEYEAAGNFAWLMPGQVDILDSQVIFDDKPTGKQHKIEQINFKLPPVAGKKTDEARIPKLTAVVNSSFIQVSAKRIETDDGTMETHLSLYSKEINLPEYFGYLPQLTEKVYFAGGNGDVHFDLIFAVNNSGEKDFILKGSASLSEVLINRADNKPLLKIPSILMTLRIKPLKRQFEIEDIVLKEPELYLDVESRALKKEKEKFAISSAAVGKFLNDLPIGIKIDRLLIDKGFVMFGSRSDKKIKNTNWQNIHLSLTGFENRKYVETAKTGSKSASFLLSGVSRSGKHSMNGSLQGTVSSFLEAEGRITVKDVDLAKYQALFLDTDKFRVSQGTMSLDSLFTYQPESSVKKSGKKAKGLHLYDGSLSLRNYTVFDGRKQLFNGTSFSCTEMDINYLEKRFFCNRLDADNNEIFSEFWGQDFISKSSGKQKTWQMSYNDLDLQDSVLHIDVPLPDNRNDVKKVTLTEVSVKASSLQKSEHAKANVAGIAKIAGKGELRVSGTYSQANSTGKLQTAFKDVELVFLKPFYAPWLVPDVLNGSFHGWGTLEMPLKRFKGKVWIEDFAAGWEKEAVIRWQKALSTGVVFTLKPLHLGIEHVIVQQPVVHFPNRERVGPIQYFYTEKAKIGKSVNISKVDINKVTVKEGQCSFADPLIADGFFPKITGVNGILTSVHSNRPITFSLKGLLNGKTDFHIKGITDLNGIQQYELAVEKLPMVSFAKDVKDTIGSVSQKTSLSLRQTMNTAGPKREFSDTVVIQGLRPRPGSSFADVFSLLIDDKEKVTFAFDRQETDDASAPLFDDVILRLKRNTIKASLSPELVLKSFFPELNLIESVPFHPGTPKSVDLSQLNDYAILLGKRPWLKLVLTGSYNPENDSRALRNFIQSRAQSERNLENQRRKTRQRKLVETQQEKLKAINKTSNKIVVEKIDLEELDKGLELLPPVPENPLPDKALETLGRQRLELVRAYLDSELGLDGDRIELSSDVMKNGSSVLVQLQPVYK